MALTSSQLYYFTASYFSNLVISAFNAQYGTAYSPSDFQIQFIPNDQNSQCAYEFFPKASGSTLRIRVYCQLGQNFQLSPFTIQSVNGGYSTQSALLVDGVQQETVDVSYGSNIAATAPNVTSIYKADFFLAQTAYSEYVAQYPSGCPPYDQWGNEAWLLSNPLDNVIITDDLGNALVMKQS